MTVPLAIFKDLIHFPYCKGTITSLHIGYFQKFRVFMSLLSLVYGNEVVKLAFIFSKEFFYRGIFINGDEFFDILAVSSLYCYLFAFSPWLIRRFRTVSGIFHNG